MATHEASAPARSTARAVPPTLTGGDEMSVAHSGHRDLVAGFLCAFSLALSGIALTRNPGLLATVAIVVALVALRMSEARQTLAAIAVTVAGLAFFFGMIIAIVTANPLY